MDVVDRLLCGAVPADGGCWVWARTCGSGGYGQLRVDGQLQYAHRLAFESWHRPLRRGELVLHSCDNPPCINPAHLRAGTHKDNMADARQRGRLRPNGGRRKLTPAVVLEIRRSSEPQSVWVKRLGVSSATISRVKTGKAWAGVAL